MARNLEGILSMKRSYGWVVVGAGALMGCVAIGTVFSLAVFLQPMSEATGWSRTGISSAMTIVFVAMGLGAFGWGALTDRFGPNGRRAVGRIAAGAGRNRSEPATSLLESQLVYGIVVGGAAGAVFAPTSRRCRAGSTSAAAWLSRWSRRAWAWRRWPSRLSQAG